MNTCSSYRNLKSPRENENKEFYKKELGKRGENAAVAYLQAKSWQIIERNWRPRIQGIRGELDIIAVDPQGWLVAVEVKTRFSQISGSAADAIDERKIRQLKALFAAWIAQSGRIWPKIRLDALLINVTSGNRLHFEHIEAI